MVFEIEAAEIGLFRRLPIYINSDRYDYLALSSHAGSVIGS